MNHKKELLRGIWVIKTPNEPPGMAIMQLGSLVYPREGLKHVRSQAPESMGLWG